MKQFVAFLLLCTLFFALGCEEAGGIRTIRLAHGLDINHSVHRAMVRMGEDLDSVSQGKLRIEIYPNQQLGTEREILELIQLGSLDMTKVSVATLENFAPKTRILGLPYLFESREHAFEVLDGPIGQSLLDNAEQFRLKGKGMPFMRRGDFGDLYVQVKTEVPVFLNKEQKDLLERFRKIENEKSNPSIKKFFQKAKSFWNG